MKLFQEVTPLSEGFLSPADRPLPPQYFEPVYRVKEVEDIPVWDSEADFDFETKRDVFIRSVIEQADIGDARPAVGKIFPRSQYMNIFTYWPGRGEPKSEVLWVYETDEFGAPLKNPDGTPKVKHEADENGVLRPLRWTLEDLNGTGYRISLPGEAWKLRQLFSDPLNASTLHIKGLPNTDQGPNSYYIDDPEYRKRRKDRRRSVEREVLAYLDALQPQMVRPLVDYLNLADNLDEDADDADFAAELKTYAVKNAETFLARTKNNANLGNELLLQAAYESRVLQSRGPEGIFYYAAGSKPRLIGLNSHIALGYLMDNQSVMADVVKRSGFSELSPYLPIAASVIRDIPETPAAQSDDSLREEVKRLTALVMELSKSNAEKPQAAAPARGPGRPPKPKD